ncbi:complement C1q-like protein 4 [Clinocottus analis]|uniref:complement C1q-like protein 4 n=1 Tax=Clinocottus analis TaxID=304258 RepID=UPI0035BF3D6F
MSGTAPQAILAPQAQKQKKMQRMETFFNMNVDALTKNLTCTKTALNNMRASRSAFSVALNHSGGYACFGPFDVDRLIPYNHVFLNLGENYNAQASNFTVPLSGVYSLAFTVYSGGSLDGELPAAAGTAGDLLVNDQVVASLKENNRLDRVDSATAVVSVKLKAGDTVAVSLPKGYHVCDDDNYFNTFTGFLLYPCDVMKE